VRVGAGQRSLPTGHHWDRSYPTCPKTTPGPWKVDQALFARLHDGQIIELWEVVDTGSGMQQLGLLVDQVLGFGSQNSP
jgi:hypothetical protein